jgi:hypothetical protein
LDVENLKTSEGWMLLPAHGVVLVERRLNLDLAKDVLEIVGFLHPEC